ncbi:dihydroxyacetone kinase transcriptional activator DhaS [Vagococcus bubulae]|uniref:Dihydroxyacetone kinase transcriptional activator DhaS n=1 Tax=Vagococcus bubulae TaxID=1977868 RepID=A0A429ZME1_9ENTE|nr:dihydroxyacetone kinase transcriptional activator DhaS [Vagococcus bubulae]RST94880.1 dihydroxyacetone kinase transcriptional activator DhaS [Vagococcus bubulae]
MASTGSLITKKVIAYSLKDLLKTTPYQKISIKDIMSNAEYRRQTFYDHFTDKEDLIIWIYQQELTEIVEHFINYDHWTVIIKRLVDYFKKNKLFYQKTLLESYVFDAQLSIQLQQFILYLITHPKKETVKQTQSEETADFYAFAVTGVIKNWLFHDCQTPKEQLTSSITTQLSFLIRDN